MSEVVPFPGKGAPDGDVIIEVSGYWSGPLFLFEVTSTAIPYPDRRLVATNDFDGAIRSALEHARIIGMERTRFVLTCEDMMGSIA